jgi:hypothetical protein
MFMAHAIRLQSVIPEIRLPVLVPGTPQRVLGYGQRPPYPGSGGVGLFCGDQEGPLGSRSGAHVAVAGIGAKQDAVVSEACNCPMASSARQPEVVCI